MAAPEQAPTAAPAFAVVRRGYDPDQVAKHLNRIDAETTILAADRAAAVEQATQLSQELGSCRKELDAAHAEIERLRGELRVLAGPPDSVTSMNDRLHVMLRLAKDEFSGLRATAASHAAAHAADIIAAVGAEAGDLGGFGFDEDDLRGPRDESELEQLRRTAAEERARLDEAAAARRATEEEEFRQVLALRCREAMAQVAKMQTEALRSARRVIDDADEQARVTLADAREAVRQTVDDAQREVDDLHELRHRLAAQLDTSRQLLNQAMPAARAAQMAAVTNGDAPASPGGDGQHAAPQPGVQQPALSDEAQRQQVVSAAAAQEAALAALQADVPGDRPIVQRAEPPAAQEPWSGQQVTGPPPPPAEQQEGTSSAQPAPAAEATAQNPPLAPPATSDPDRRPAAPTAQPAAPAAAPLPPPTLPAVAGLPVPAGWPVAPGTASRQPSEPPAPPSGPPPAPPSAEPPRHAAPDPDSALEQTQPGLPEFMRSTPEEYGGHDAHRAQPVRIPPRETPASDVPAPSGIPVDEQDTQIAPPRRYP